MPFGFLLRRSAKRKGFSFLETGPLCDGELELIQPVPAWLDAVVAASEHPDTRKRAPSLHNVNREQLADFLAMCPLGRHWGDAKSGQVPAYHFWMVNRNRPDFPVAGGIGLRIGHTADLELYYGHIGYHVFPAHWGNHFAERAVRLLLPLAARHGLSPLWITCNPDNAASRRTCERLGAALVDTVPVPTDHPLHQRGEKQKCRYRLKV